MNALGSLTLIICAVVIGSSMLSVLTPQKRTKRVFGFVLGLFIITSLISAVKGTLSEIHIDIDELESSISQGYDNSDYVDAVAEATADNLVEAIDGLLKGEGIIAEDIRLSLKISSEGRITVDSVSIYISESYKDRKQDIRSIVYRNLSKEPDVYVKNEKAE